MTKANCAPDPQLKQEAIFEYPDGGGPEYCLIDPPLTELGRKQASHACKVFKKLKHHRFPMPKRAFVSPLLRTMETFQIATKNIGIKSDESYILFNLREKEEGNCADILIDEYTSQRKLPGEWNHQKIYTKHADEIYRKMPGKDIWYEIDKNVQKRADIAREDIAQMDDGTCVLLVTHSMLIQNDLKCLEDRPRKEATALTSFMLGEAGMMAILVEGPKPDEEATKAAIQRREGLMTVQRRQRELRKELNEDRRVTAFPNTDEEKRLLPVAVPIEQAIVKVYKRTKSSV